MLTLRQIKEPSVRGGALFRPERPIGGGSCSQAGEVMAKNGADSYDESGKMKRKTYEKELHKLQVKLCLLQEWVKK
jgi:hypothetical protein